MKGRKQKISEDTCSQNDRAALESYAGGQTFIWMTESEDAKENVERKMLEYVLSPANLNVAYKQVVRNKGAGGIDRMEVEELKDYLIAHKEALLQSVLSGTYQPQAVKRVEIPKSDGGKRKLGIPTVIDRLLQQAINQVLTPLYEKQFSDNSYGFRPKRSAHQALKKVQRYVETGYIYAADMDLEKYFDTVNQSKLIEVLSRTIKDGRVKESQEKGEKVDPGSPVKPGVQPKGLYMLISAECEKKKKIAIFVGVKTHFGRSKHTIWSGQTPRSVRPNDVCLYKDMVYVYIET